MNNALRGILAVAVVAAMGSEANAASITINANPGTLYATTALSSFETSGADMVGMQVRAVIAGQSYNGVWTQQDGGFLGGFADGGYVMWDTTGGDPSLAIAGQFFGTSDTFFDQWQLNVTAGDTLQDLYFFGAPGRTVFDRTNPSTGTPGSDQGMDFSGFCTVSGGGCSTSSPSGNIVATYSDLLRIGSAAPVGDLYVSLHLDFKGVTGGGLAANDYRFNLDTDNAAVGAVILPVDVPEPTSMALLGAAVLFGLSRRLRRRA